MNSVVGASEETNDAAYPLLREIEQCVEAAQSLPALPSEPLQELREKIGSHTFNLVVVGEFKRGKSSIINALMGANLLPVGVVPLTAAATLLSYGEEFNVEVCFQNGECRRISPFSLPDYVTEKGNPRNEKGVREVRISYPSDWLKSGVRLVDTPGIGSVYRHNTDVTYQFLPKADAVLLTLSVNQPLGQAEYDFLKQVGEYAGKIFVLLNKADLLTESELNESLHFCSGVIAEALGKPVPVFPVSARLALEAKAKDSAELLARSRFPEFSEALSRFLMEEKGNALVVSVARNLQRLIAQARFTAELTLQSLRTPVQELQRKIESFEGKRREILQAKNDFVILLENEVKRLADHTVTEDVEDFKMKLAQTLETCIRQKFEENRQLPSKDLHETLERFAVDQVRESYDAFREREDDKVEETFIAICSRFTLQIDATVDELFRFSAELFAIPFDAVKAESAWQERSQFYYKFWSEPGSLQMITSSFILSLPKFLGDALILKECVKYGHDLVDTQAGRIRYDFAQRLDKSMRKFKSVMLSRIDTTLAGIEQAVHKGTEIGAEGEREVMARSSEIAAFLQALDGLTGRLGRILEAVNPG